VQQLVCELRFFGQCLQRGFYRAGVGQYHAGMDATGLCYDIGRYDHDPAVYRGSEYKRLFASFGFPKREPIRR
jgi:hypothetical protein